MKRKKKLNKSVRAWGLARDKRNSGGCGGDGPCCLSEPGSPSGGAERRSRGALGCIPGGIFPGISWKSMFLRLPPCAAGAGTGRAHPRAGEGAGTRSHGLPSKPCPCCERLSLGRASLWEKKGSGFKNSAEPRGERQGVQGRFAAVLV